MSNPASSHNSASVAFSPNRKNSGHHLALDLGIDDREKRRPSAERPVAPYDDCDAAARPQHAPHFADARTGSGMYMRPSAHSTTSNAASGSSSFSASLAREARVRRAALLCLAVAPRPPSGRAVDAHGHVPAARPHPPP
jgi:hypothetical protein